MGINVVCQFCHNKHVIEVNEQDFYKWQNGEKIQNAMPYLKDSERELLISNVCDPCWNKLF